MNVEEISVIAGARGLKRGRLNKVDLVRMIQRDEGNFDCFATDIEGTCDQYGCLWRNDCHALAQRKAALK